MQYPSQLHLAKSKNIPEIQRLLKSVGLPYIDIGAHIDHFIFLEDENGLIGCVGLQVYQDIALLRSLAVDEGYRNQGLGKILVKEILQYAAGMQIKKLYLLTTTAETFFAKLGFIRKDRKDAPEAIRGTSEFSTLCPSTAVFMSKFL